MWKKSTNFAVLSELGRLPLHLNIVKAQMLYWHRLENLSDNFSILKDAFNLSKDLYQKQKPSWYGSINILKNLFFEKHDGLKDISAYNFKKSLKEMMKDHYIGLWYKQKSLLGDGKLSVYTNIKHNFGYENYLTIISDFEQRRKLTQFRISAHRLRIELGRYQGILRQDRLCLHCSEGVIEDEKHFLFHCSFFSEDRLHLNKCIYNICPNYKQLQTSEKLLWLLNCEYIDILKSLCFYLSKHFVHN